MTLRLRQVCLVAPRLAPVVDTIETILGLPVCHRDPAVAAYGLENALFVCGHQFLEVVAPTRDGTAAGRYLRRSGGRGASMAAAGGASSFPSSAGSAPWRCTWPGTAG